MSNITSKTARTSCSRSKKLEKQRFIWRPSHHAHAFSGYPQWLARAHGQNFCAQVNSVSLWPFFRHGQIEVWCWFTWLTFLCHLTLSRGICNSHFDNGTRNGVISILKWGKILVSNFTNVSWNWTLNFIVANETCGFIWKWEKFW